MNKGFYRFSVLLFLLFLVPPSFCHAWSGRVVYVVDGDTIDIERNGKSVRIRLYGVDTPEPDQPYGREAKIFTLSRVSGKKVEVEMTGDIHEERFIGIVTVGDLNLNEHLVEYGYAWVHPGYCDKFFCSEWARIEAAARKAKKGLWKDPQPIPPWDYRYAKRR